MTKGNMPYQASSAPHDRRDSRLQVATIPNNQASSYFTQKPQCMSPGDIPEESRELSQATSRLNATLDSSNHKMQRIIEETRAHFPDQPTLPHMPQTANKTDASPPWHCGCEDELYTADGCQCYKVVTSAAADLAARLARGLKRKHPYEDDDMMKAFSMWEHAVTENRSSLIGGEVEDWMLHRHRHDRSSRATSEAEKRMLMRHPLDRSPSVASDAGKLLLQSGRPIVPLPSGRQQRTKAEGQAQDSRRVKKPV